MYQKLQERKTDHTNKGKSFRINADFSMKTFKVRRKLNNNFEVFKGYYDGRPRVVYPEKFSVMAKGERKAFNTTKIQQTKPTECNIHVEEQLSTAKRLWKEIKNKAIMVKTRCTTENTHKNQQQDGCN